MKDGMPIVMSGLDINIIQKESSKVDAKYSVDIVFHGRTWLITRTYSAFQAFHAALSAEGLDASLDAFPVSHKHTNVVYLEEYLTMLFSKSYAEHSLLEAGAAEGQQGRVNMDIATALMNFLDDDAIAADPDTPASPSCPPATRDATKSSALTTTLFTQVTHLSSKLQTYDERFAQLTARLKYLEDERTGRRADREAGGDEDYDDSLDISRDRSGASDASGLGQINSAPGPDEFFRRPDDATPPLDAPLHTYAASALLPLECIPVNAAPSLLDVRVEQIMTLILPQDPQKKYRDSALAHAARLVRRELKGTVYEVSLGSVSCFLPDDPVRLSVLVRRTQASTWHEDLAYRIHGVSKDPSATLFTGGARMSDRNGDDDDDDDDDEGHNVHLPGVTHVLSTLRVDARPKGSSGGFGGEAVEMPALGEAALSRDKGGASANCEIVPPPQPKPGSTQEYQLSYMLDQHNEVSIIATGREDLCLLAFIEEFSTLVAQDDLFKRSLCLIRAWFLYEGRYYENLQCPGKINPLRGFLTENAFAILVMAIFNVHAGKIRMPLHALCIFLAEYAGLDWANVCVTLQGVVPFVVDVPETVTKDALAGGIGASGGLGLGLGLAGGIGATFPEAAPEDSESRLIPHALVPQENHVATPLMIMRYWELFNLSGVFGGGGKPRTDQVDGGAGTGARSTAGSMSGAGSSVGGFSPQPGQCDSGRRSGLTTLDTGRSSDTGSARGNLTHRSCAESDDGHSRTGSGGSRSARGAEGTVSNLASLAAAKEAEHVVLPHQTIRAFARREINILHPLNYSINMYRSDGAMLSGNFVVANHEERAALGPSPGEVVTAIKFSNVLEQGATRLAKLLQGPDAEKQASTTSPSTAVAVDPAGGVTLTSFFEHTIRQYGQGFRPDVIGNRLWVLTFHILGTGALEREKAEKDKVKGRDHASPSPVAGTRDSIGRASTGSQRDSVSSITSQASRRDSTTSVGSASSTSSGSKETWVNSHRGMTHEDLWDLVLYCNLVWEQRITATALLKAARDILIERRSTLPVGEIGKTLQELASMQVISGKLKESFGGLKKFLEMFPDEFVICIDHPFNPHVFLRKTLSADEQQICTTQSVVPAYLLAKNGKAGKKAGKKKKKRGDVKGGGQGSDWSSNSGSRPGSGNYGAQQGHYDAYRDMHR